MACLAQASTAADPSLMVLLNGSNASISWNATLSGPVNLQHSANLSSWATISAYNTTGSFLHMVGNATRGFYILRVPGIFAQAPSLADFSDSGTSSIDGVTYDRTPTLAGSVLGAVSHVRISMNGQPGAVVPVAGGMWTYTVPAEAPLTAGIHTITVTPMDASEAAGDLSSPLFVSIKSTPPAAPTLGLENLSDSGAKGDGLTTEAEPVFSGTATPVLQVKVNIDGVPVGIAQSDANTGAWSFKSPRLANGVHEVSVVSTDQAGLDSAPKDLTVEIFGPRTVMLDASSGWTVELTPSHILGGQSQGFIVTKVHGGTLQKWVAADNAWVQIPAEALGTDPTTLENAPAIRTIAYADTVRWTPAASARGMGAAFDVVPLDRQGGTTASTPQAGTVPGKIASPRILATEGVGTTISWSKPTDGCGCASTRYSIQLTREDGQTLLYNLAYSVNQLASVEGGAILNATIWAATKTGAGEARTYDARGQRAFKSRVAFTSISAFSAIDLSRKARAQLAVSPTGVDIAQSGFRIGASHENLAYVEVHPIENSNRVAVGALPIVSSDSNKLTAAQKATLKKNPILSRHLFPGTIDGEVPPDHMRVHFQPGQKLRFAGNVDASVRAGATIVVESAQTLGDGSCGPWLEEARIAVGSDGDFSHDYTVPYGMVSLRQRLEYSPAIAPTSLRSANSATLGATAPTLGPVSTPIDLSTYFNAFGITTPSWQVGNNQGFDGYGNYYNSDYNVSINGTQNAPVAGTPIVYNGITFPIGPVPTNANQVGGTEGVQNFVRATGQTITVSVDADKSDYLYLAGAASNGNQLSQTITLNFTDGTTEKWTQSFHDWASDGPPQSSNPPWAPTSMTVPGANSKFPVRVATTESLQNTNSSSTPETFSGLQTIDGVALAEGDRVLVKNQNNEQSNGIYVASAGTWSRANDALTPEQQWNESVSVLSGTTNGGKYFWENTSPYASSILQAEAAELHQKIESKERELMRVELTDPREIEQLQQQIAGYRQQLVANKAKLSNLIAMEYPITFVEITPPVPTPRPFSGELNLKTEPERINQRGDLVTTPAHIFAYCRNLHGKQLASFTLPNNSNIGILSAVVSKAPVITLDEGVASVVLATTNLTGVDLMTLTIVNESNIGVGGSPLTFSFADQPVKGSTTTPPTYATKQVTVPMGQQTTIVYVAPDSTTQMTFSVQKADNTCVGSTCSTYLPDWTDGSGGSGNWASNISPSLNSQMKAGQHWTMTVQNSGEGYYGYLNSPSGKNLPGASGNTPAGAQFKLMTQAEINSQPAWATALEKDIGKIVGLVILSVATGGIAGELAVVGETAGVAIEEGADVVDETMSVTARLGDDIDEEIDVDFDFQGLETGFSDGDIEAREDDFLLKLDGDDLDLPPIHRDSINNLDEFERNARQEWQQKNVMWHLFK